MHTAATSDAIASASPIGRGEVTGNEAQRRAADAAVDAACRAAAQRIWSPSPSPSPEYLDPWVAQEIQESAVAFVVARREELPPEQILASLKVAFNEALLRHGDARDQHAVRGLLLAAFLRAYYGDGRRR